MPKFQPNVFDPNCDSRQVLALVADRWSMLVIYALSSGVKRHGELKRMIGGISQKMLTQTLRSLERDGIVRRRVHAVVPPRVEYSLTALGKTLLGPLRSICRWAENHISQVRAARENSSARRAHLPRQPARHPSPRPAQPDASAGR
jgi:DNA-binding HxlR family transcriptional regulator